MLESGPRGQPFSNIVIVGASGDLAQKKIIPSLFALRSQGFLPSPFRVFGFGRTAMTDEEFRRRCVEHLTCRYVPGESCAAHMERFLADCHYVEGRYEAPESFLDLYQKMKDVEGSIEPRSIFYLAIPPSIFVEVSQALGASGLVRCGEGSENARVVVEKPFGRDRASFDAMDRALGQVFSEDQVYRIDHYLGKEVVRNLLVLRFANYIFEPLWSRDHVRSVEIVWKEDIGVEERGRYFDEYGIIRDVMQNHLLQILALVAMERPESLNANAIKNAKLAVLRSIAPLGTEDLVVGQYHGKGTGGDARPSYTAEKYVAPNSITPTYAAAVLRVDSARWRGVPFLMRAGKGLDSRVTEIRMRFRPVSGELFGQFIKDLRGNELVVRVQPDEGLYFRIVNKVPAVRMQLAETDLDLRYKAAFQSLIPDAYEYLLLDIVHGDRSLFIRRDELAAAWDIFTPALHELERRATRPDPYVLGTAGPSGVKSLMERYAMDDPQ